MSATAPRLADLKHQRPEWTPWLEIVEAILVETEAPSWDECVPVGTNPVTSAAPRLTRTTVAVPVSSTRGLLDRVLRIAARSGTHEMATLALVADARPDAQAMFQASLCHDAEQIAALAKASGADRAALQAVAALVPVPFLQACNRRWRSSVSEEWVSPFCPVCGSWPAFAEVRGIERKRYYRCGRCGGEWHAHGLSCPFCSTTNHHDLVVLMPQRQGMAAAVDACKRCGGYVKTFNRLQACPPAAVLLEDLGGVALDVAALEHGYSRPAGAAYPLELTVIDRHAAPSTGVERMTR